MTYEEIINAVSKIGNGQYVRICYQSELPLKASFKKQNPGSKIIKVTETTVRLGVDYDNIQSVIDRKSNESPDKEKKNYTNNFSWIIENVVKYNSNTDKNYLCVATVKNHSNSHSVIYNNDKETSIEEVKENIIPSYFNKGSDREVYTIKFDNIIKIGG